MESTCIANICSLCGSRNTARHRRTAKHKRAVADIEKTEAGATKDGTEASVTNEATPVGSEEKWCLPWGRNGKWPKNRPPVHIDGLNRHYKYIEADGSKYQIECVTVDKERYFYARDVCHMLRADIAHNQPNSTQIRQKLLIDADLGILRTSHSRRVGNTGQQIVLNRLFFTFNGLMLYVIKTKPKSQVSKDLTKWVLNIIKSVYETGHHVSCVR